MVTPLRLFMVNPLEFFSTILPKIMQVIPLAIPFEIRLTMLRGMYWTVSLKYASAIPCVFVLEIISIIPLQFL